MVGTKWYKCDLHLHTPASKCFHDRDTVTPEQWVQEAIDKGLNCVAVTDHNSAEWVELIQEEASKKGLNVFPGVELTCSEAKVHILVLFEIGTNRRTIEDFITLCRIDNTKFGEQDAHSPLSVEEVIKEASNKNALCIPAHIDEYAGLGQVAHGLREKLFQSDIFLGVQVVHKEFLVEEGKFKKQEALISINKFRGATDEEITSGKLKISEEKLKEWRSPVQQSIKHSKAILTFSDNPHSEFNSKHGLWGMGRRFTWIKMDQKPSLESLRQAMLLHQFRIKNDFDCPDQPYSIPDTWIQSITIKETELSKSGNDVLINFNPQMNTIIGGRGSGKSSILQFLRGVFEKGHEIDTLTTIKTEFSNFFKVKDKKKQGVLKAACSIEILINRRDELYKVLFKQETPIKHKTQILKFNEISGYFDVEQNLSFMKILDFDIFSQKQIYEIANNLNSLRDRIDVSSFDISKQQDVLENKKAEYIKQSSEIRALKLKVSKKDVLKSEIQDIENKINKVKEIGIENELKKIQNFNSENIQFINFRVGIESEQGKFDSLTESVRGLKLKPEAYTESSRIILEGLINNVNSEIAKIAVTLEKTKSDFVKLNTFLEAELSANKWSKDKKETEESFEKKKETLIGQGIVKIEEIEADIKLLAIKKSELESIEKIETEITEKEAALASIKELYITERLKLSTVRKEFLEGLLYDGKVRAKVNGCKDFENLEEQIRLVLSSPESFDKDVATMIEYWSGPDVKRANKGVFDIIVGIHNGTNTGADFDKRFITKVKGLNGEQLDSFDLMFPEDVIQLEYKTNAGVWKALSNASAGQKTAAILTLILSEGNKPLILDQPEDDLDNYLIYDLVVDQLRKSKESRQIITVTHNANIPVNGDSEVIIVMDSETKHLSPKLIGTIEDDEIKKAVCSIMEGGTDAFNMRSKRYQNVKTNG
ncbi:MAG: PHP domain-containing protein [Bacteroidia bacterium]|jgi:energy-coupling factor transporter ATP-binding protein EcfA2|nr:PHP domain-containing protein [Bacteroidia bacterium]